MPRLSVFVENNEYLSNMRVNGLSIFVVGFNPIMGSWLSCLLKSESRKNPSDLIAFYGVSGRLSDYSIISDFSSNSFHRVRENITPVVPAPP